jgi:CubicO group peptidase (beta-lactamase class C family)
MSRVEKLFLEKLGDAWKEATPGLVIQVYEAGRKKIDLELGETYKYYDWASLTKIVHTSTKIMNLVDEKKLNVNDQANQHLPWFQSSAPKENQKIKNLLSHSAGLTWWLPLYKSIDTSLPRVERWNQLEKIIAEEMKKASREAFNGKSVYSDLDFFSLGAIMKRVTNQDFNEMWEPIRERLKLEETFYHLDNKPKFARKNYAPLEDLHWTMQTVQGEVHDQNTRALGGAAPHAGLFGPMKDLSRWGLLLRAGIRGSDKSIAKAKTVQRFTRRAIPREVGDWGLGFMMPSKGSASCGKYFSVSSVGHTGFTGTSLWYDPKRDLLVTILANRYRPIAENKTFPLLRPQLHNWIVESL